MQPASSQQTPWVTIAIFGLTGLIAGELGGGALQAIIGLCLGIMCGSLSGPRGVVIGYFAAGMVLAYGCISFYTTATLPEVQAAQVSTLTRSVPMGSTFDRVYRYLKATDASHVTLGQAYPAASMLVADYNSRFLLRSLHYRTKFVFDKHQRLYRCWVVSTNDGDI